MPPPYATFDWSNLISGLIGAVVGAVVAGLLTIWEAAIGRKHGRMEKAVSVYRELADRRNKLLLAVGDAFGIDKKSLGDPAYALVAPEIAKLNSGKAAAQAEAHCKPIEDLLWIVMTCDSAGLRRSAAVIVVQTLGEIRDALKAKDYDAFKKRCEEERRAFDPMMASVSELNEALPALPQFVRVPALSRWFGRR